MPVTKSFDREYLRDELGLPLDCYEGEIISRRIVSRGRWSIQYELIFRFNDQPVDEAWMVEYQVGATEQQDEMPWQYDKEVTATLVKKTTKVVEAWIPTT
jgi:hypothetical protein